ncbi:MAG: PqqD family protein [Planctomycetes bacterium]|nr:PqqD family protein [Planctomycetota bacterium]
MSESLSRNSVVTKLREQIAASLGAEAVILHLESGIYYGLNEVGARIWSLVEEPRTVQALIDAIVAEYDVEPEQCARDVETLLGRLVEKRLISISPPK